MQTISRYYHIPGEIRTSKIVVTKVAEFMALISEMFFLLIIRMIIILSLNDFWEIGSINFKKQARMH
jgi:hypothetical protein